MEKNIMSKILKIFKFSVFILIFVLNSIIGARTDKETERLCFSGNYENYKKITGYKTIQHFVDDQDIEIGKTHPFYSNLFITGKKGSISVFITKVIVEIFLIFLSFLLFINYFVFLCLWKENKCLFKIPTQKDILKKMKHCKYGKIVFIIIFLFLSLGLCFFGLIRLSVYKRMVVLSDCSFLHFANHGLYGLFTSEEYPHYAGVENLKETFFNESYSLLQLDNTINNLFLYYSTIINLENNYYFNLEIYNKYATENYIPSPDPTKSQSELYPTNYQKFYGPYTNPSTLLGMIHKNHEDYIKPILADLKKIKDDFDSLLHNKNIYANELSKKGKKFEAMTQMFDLIKTNIGKRFEKFKKITSVILNVLAYLLLVIISLLSLLIIVFLLIYVCKKEATILVTKYSHTILNVSWNILFFITAISLLLSASFGIFRVYGYNFIPSFNHFISSDIITNSSLEENIFSGVSNKEEALIFNACYNSSKSTNFIDIMGIGKTMIEKFNSLIQNYNSLLENLNNSNSMPDILPLFNELNQKLDYYILEFTEATSPSTHFTDDVSIYIKELNRYTDYYDENGYQIDCVTKIFDRWVNDKTHCPNGYLYSIDGTYARNCLVFDDWDVTSVEARYMPVCLTKSGDDIDTIINRYYGRLKLFISKNKDLINKMKNGDNDLYNTYKQLLENINLEINSDNSTFQNFTFPFIEFAGYQKDTSIMNLFDCGILKDDLIDFYDLVRKKFNKQSYVYLFTFLIMAILNTIAIYLLVSDIEVFNRKETTSSEDDDISVPVETMNNKKKKILPKKENDILTIKSSNKKSSQRDNNKFRGSKSKLFSELSKFKPNNIKSKNNKITTDGNSFSDGKKSSNADSDFNDRLKATATKYNNTTNKIKEELSSNDNDEDSDKESGPRDGTSNMS